MNAKIVNQFTIIIFRYCIQYLVYYFFLSKRLTFHILLTYNLENSLKFDYYTKKFNNTSAE